VKDLFDDSLDVPVFFGIVDGAEFDSSLARAGVCLEDGGFTLPLCLNVFSHGVGGFCLGIVTKLLGLLVVNSAVQVQCTV